VEVPFFSEENNYFSSGKIDLSIVRIHELKSSTDAFGLAPARITSYIPSEANSFSSILVTGAGFHPDFTTVKVGTHECSLLYIYPNRLRAKLPPLFHTVEDTLRISVANRVSTAGPFTLNAPQVSSLSADTVFSYEEITFYGRHLDVEKLDILFNNEEVKILEKSSDSIQVKVPGTTCTDRLHVHMQIEENTVLLPRSLHFRQPQNFEISVEPNDYFNATITITGENIPEVGYPENFRINGLKANLIHYGFDGPSSNIQLGLPKDAIPEDSVFNAEIQFCPSTRISLDFIHHIPAPQIHEIEDTMYTFSSFTIHGDFFNSLSKQNKVYLGETLIDTRVAIDLNTLIIDTPKDMEEGIYPLRVETNGQNSEPVDVEVVHRWNKLANLPKMVEGYRILFLDGNKLYLGGGIWNAHKNFFSFDMETGEWSSKSPLPKSARHGISDGEYGYVYGDGELYRYDFEMDSWTLLGKRPVNNTLGGFYIAESSGAFIHKRKIYILPVGITKTHHHFDLDQNSWERFPGWQGSARGQWVMSSVLGQDEAYLFHEWDIFTLDLKDLSFTDAGQQRPDNNKSSIGFKYRGEAYLYDKWGWEIYDIDDSFSVRRIPGPPGYKAVVLREGDTAYLLTTDEIWSFDLRMQ
jgi:hypothetical protein